MAHKKFTRYASTLGYRISSSMDPNGNSIIIIKTPAGSFSVQSNGVIDTRKEFHQLFKDLQEHIDKYGTKRQHRILHEMTAHLYEQSIAKGSRQIKSNPVRKGRDLDTQAVRELEIFGDNDEQVNRQQGDPIRKNLLKKFKKGIYNHTLAIKLWGYFANTCAKKYGRDNGNNNGYEIFPPDVRRATAKIWADNYLDELNSWADLGVK